MTEESAVPVVLSGGRPGHLRTVPFWTWEDPGTETELDALVARLRSEPPRTVAP